jgi:hypothetical protein
MAEVGAIPEAARKDLKKLASNMGEDYITVEAPPLGIEDNTDDIEPSRANIKKVSNPNPI